MDKLLFGKVYYPDPIHLNDIEPILKDGPFWKKGDVFLSIRDQSMIVLFRPTTNKILNVIQGPFNMQHDIDIISDEEIMRAQQIVNDNVPVLAMMIMHSTAIRLALGHSTREVVQS